MGNQRAYDIAEDIVTFAAGASIPLTNAIKMGKVVTTVDKAKFIGIELSKEVVGTAGGFGGVWLGQKLGLSQDQSMFLGMIASIASSKGADWVDNNFDNLVLAGKYTFNNSGKNVTLSMNGTGTLNTFIDTFTDIKNGKIVFNSIDDVINLGINSVDDLMKLGVNSVDDLAKLKVSSIDDLAKIGIKNADDLAKLGIDSSDLKKIGIDPKVFENGSKIKIDYNLTKDYIRDIESRTGIKLSKNQVKKLKEALRNKEYTKLNTKETAKHRNEFNKIKNDLINQWEINTGQK